MKITFDHVTSIYNAGTCDEHIALKDIRIELDTRQIIGICGMTGSGKSTFIRHLNGILKPASGRVLIDGVDIHSSKDTLRHIRRRIGMIFQFPERQLFGRTVWEELSYTLERRQIPKQEIEQRIIFVCELLNFKLQQFRDRSPFSLSRGEQRKLGIAVILALQPELLALDEPTAGMDRTNAYQFLEVLQTLHHEKHYQVILVSHDIDLLLKYTENLIMLNAGEILLSGPPYHIINAAEHLEACGMSLPPVYRSLHLFQEHYPQFHSGVSSVDEAVEEVTKNVKHKT